MPTQGWTPLEVNFSADDSYSTNGKIIKYEWDLDGNGRFDTDATGTNGYVSYNYLDNGNYDVIFKDNRRKGLYRHYYCSGKYQTSRIEQCGLLDSI